MERETTIRELFIPNAIQFRIPNYQRAYSWEQDRQVQQFIEDLREHPKASEDSKPYYLGHFLFESAAVGSGEFWVIDGQQRLTTIILFFQSLWQELTARKQRGESVLAEFNPDQFRRSYVENEGQRKLRTVSYDEPFLHAMLLNGVTQERPDTLSARRLAAAMERLAKEMRTEERTEEPLSWLALVENAVVTTYEVRNKEQATQIFAFQNDRGKDLTKLEKLKAFLMHQVYVHSPYRLVSESIEDVDMRFADIYKMTESIESLDEDQVLGHHLTAFLAQTDNVVELMRRRLKQQATGKLKMEWIRGFCADLRNSFQNVKLIEEFQYGGAPHEQLVGDVLHLHAWAAWPLLLKLMHHHHHDLPKLEELLRLMEITLFKLQFMSGKSANSLPNFATEYDGNLENLVARLRHTAQHGFKDYWDFNGELKAFIDGNHHYRREIKYLLWKYENNKRQEHRVGRLSLREYINDVPGQSLDASIEHIMPQNPDGVTHSETFEKEYLHNLGNLVLMTRGGNSSVSNALPVDKAARLKATTYLTQREVAETILKQGVWAEKEIATRKQQIVDFAMRYWRVGGETRATQL